MKRHFLLYFIAIIGLSAWGQQRATIPADLKNYGIKKDRVDDNRGSTQFENPAYKEATLTPVETQMGDSRYDRQTNSTTQNRLYHFDDGTFGATWMTGFNDPNFNDRGTGYNYYNGNEWGEFPFERIESQRSGWPCYGPLGENGEIIISHISGGTDDGLLVNRRADKGTGDWNEYLYQGPAGGEALLWPSFITSGVDYNTIHLLSVTRPVANGGQVYQGLDGAMLYSRSTDGGETWDMNNVLLEELSSSYYTHFNGDEYDITERDGVVAFVSGGPFNEAILMKSTDNGDTWEKTIIWEHPYPFWASGSPTDTFYCVDGSWDVKLDNEGMAHVVFGINRARADESGTYWFPFIDGVGYWDETMPAFSGTFEALNPYGDEGSELIEDYNLIGWSQDMDGDGEINFVGTAIDNIGAYYVGLSSMVQLAMGPSNELYVFFSSVTETYDNGQQNFRHLWSRVSVDNGQSWGHFTQLTADFIHIFDECVFPAVAQNQDPETIYLIYQQDSEPGMAVAGDEDPYGDNYWVFMEISKDEITVVDDPANSKVAFKVSQNFPNPFSGETRIGFELSKPAVVSAEVIDVTGRLVLKMPAQQYSTGSHLLAIDGNGLTQGVYFYTVKAGKKEVTRKMVVE